MNASEQIVKSYFEHIKHLFTRSNIKGVDQCELDLIGINTENGIKYFHIETTISIADGFSKITNAQYDPETEKIRVKSAKQKKTAGYFISKKFYSEAVLKSYEKLGIDQDNLERIIVAWGFDQDAITVLNNKNIQCKCIKDIFQELADHISLETANLDDDILKTIQLLVRSKIKMPEIVSNTTARKRKKIRES